MSPVEGQQPALGDAAGPKAIEADCRPPTLVAAEYGRALSENSNVIAVADQHLAWVHPEGPRREVTASGEVAHHGLDSFVVPTDGVPAGNVPDNVLRELLAEGVPRPTRVEGSLQLVQLP
jgi:hypothetical protein